MPEQSHPPYAPTAKYQPRLLNRWLDINPQNGPLRRTQTYISLPVFNVPIVWKGYSEIVASFNFEGPNNFSLTSLTSELPLNPNYLLCIMWEDSNHVVRRYSLWSNIGEIIFFQLIPYTGQIIKKNFRLEVWSINNSPSINLAPINFYTSVLGIQDYRYAIDNSLILADAIVTNFQCPLIPNSPIVMATDQWKPFGIDNSGTVLNSWNPSQGTGNLSISLGTPTVDISESQKSLILTGSEVKFNLSSTTTNITNLYFIMKTSTNNGAILFTEIGPTHQMTFNWSIVSSIFKFQAAASTSSSFTFPIGVIVGFSVIITGLTNCVITAYDTSGSIIGTCNITTPVMLTEFLDIGVIDNIYEIFHTVLPIDFVSYFVNNYGGFALPLVFPSNSIPALN